VLDQGPPRAGTAVRGRHEQHLDPGPFDEHEGVRAPRPIAQAKDRREARQFLPDQRLQEHEVVLGQEGVRCAHRGFPDFAQASLVCIGGDGDGV